MCAQIERTRGDDQQEAHTGTPKECHLRDDGRRPDRRRR